MSIYLMKDGQQTGPHDEAVVAGWIATGKCSLQDPAWKEGMSAWQPLSTLNLVAAAPNPKVADSTPWSQRFVAAIVGAAVFAPFAGISLIIGCLGSMFLMVGAFAGGVVAGAVHLFKAKHLPTKVALPEVLMTSGLAGAIGASGVLIVEIAQRLFSTAAPSSSDAGTGFFMWWIFALAQSAFIIAISVFGGLGAWGLMGSSRKT